MIKKDKCYFLIQYLPIIGLLYGHIGKNGSKYCLCILPLYIPIYMTPKYDSI